MGQAKFSVWGVLYHSGRELAFERVQDYECQYSSSVEFKFIGQYLIALIFNFFFQFK